jgi:hypothetical protein
MNFEPLLYFNQPSPFLSAAIRAYHDPRVSYQIPNVTSKTVMATFVSPSLTTNLAIHHLPSSARKHLTLLLCRHFLHLLIRILRNHMIEAIMSRIFVVFFLNRGAADICTATFFALTKVFFAFVAAGVAAVVLGAHFDKEKVEKCS